MTNYISRNEADELCDELIRHFLSGNATPPFVDIDSFVQDFMKCSIFYEHFAEEDPDKIGFTGDGRSPLMVRRGKEVQSVVFPRNTIVLDRFLLKPAEEYRRRFVLSHEIGHILANQINPESAACFHRTYDKERTYTISEMKSRYAMGEWQANAIGAALLMPRFLIRDTLLKFTGATSIPVYGNAVFHPREKVILQKMADSLRVSYTALVIRLRDLKCLEYRPLAEYIQQNLGLGGVPL